MIYFGNDHITNYACFRHFLRTTLIDSIYLILIGRLISNLIFHYNNSWID